jgi:hypothetical protein
VVEEAHGLARGDRRRGVAGRGLIIFIHWGLLAQALT